MFNLKKYKLSFLQKLRRLKGTPYSIAAGFACGVAISFTPFIGFHMIIAAVTAFIIRGSIVSSAVGTLIGNPWTFPIIWVTVLYTGRFFLGLDGDAGSVDFGAIFKSAGDAIWHLNFENFGRDVWPVVHPMIVGCIPYYIASWLISYVLIKRTLDKLNARRLARQNNKGD